LEEQFDLSPDEITRIVGFLGYGRLSAPVWFIGIEEGLGGMTPTDERWNLRARAAFEKTMDLHEAHKSLHKGGRPIAIESKPPSTQVWKYMAKMMLADNGERDWKNQQSVEEYIQFQLGRSNGQTFLTELSPIPARGTAHKKWAAFFRERDPNLDSKLQERRNELRAELKGRRPYLVVCYGLGRKQDFAELLDVEWNEPIDVKCKKKIAKIYASKDGGCLLLPFFGYGQMCHKVIEVLLDLGLLGPSRSPTLRM